MWHVDVTKNCAECNTVHRFPHQNQNYGRAEEIGIRIFIIRAQGLGSQRQGYFKHLRRIKQANVLLKEPFSYLQRPVSK